MNAWRVYRSAISEGKNKQETITDYHGYEKKQQVSPGRLFYQPQTPVIAMIKAKRMITEAVNHFPIFI